ncbi:hypothetical protein [uncultured Brevundimonas sp.]|uniref:hypothetical protein n=1 Tax=uncultured Brevundimonas sp. TaxID=213418 RepID=UPI0025DD7196|nr:hypothetical protein [uncultured Brevundimonas sp.]
MVQVEKRGFEGLLVLGAAAETLHLIGLFDRRAEVDGVALAVVFTVVTPWVVPMMGLAITRLKSAVAKWVFLLLMSVVWLNMVKLGLGEWWGNPWLTLGFVAGVAQTLAAFMLLTPPSWRWTHKTRRVGKELTAP